MRWKVWPRQYGKTYQLGEWWLEDPARRVLLCGTEVLARYRRDELRHKLHEKYPGTTRTDAGHLLKGRIMSWRTWQNGHPTTATRLCEIAVDDLDYILPALFRGDVVYVAGAGSNDIPDPEIADQVDKFAREVRDRYGITGE